MLEKFQCLNQLPYCSNCGVEIDYNINNCPLCDFKRKTFFAITALLLLNTIIFIAFNMSNFRLNTDFFIIILFVLSIWFYLIFLFGMISNNKITIFYLVLNTFFFTFLIDLYYVGLGWFFPVFLPSTILGTIILIIVAVRVRLKKTKTFAIMGNDHSFNVIRDYCFLLYT
jgi:hypothetical protein